MTIPLVAVSADCWMGCELPRSMKQNEAQSIIIIDNRAEDAVMPTHQASWSCRTTIGVAAVVMLLTAQSLWVAKDGNDTTEAEPAIRHPLGAMSLPVATGVTFDINTDVAKGSANRSALGTSPTLGRDDDRFAGVPAAAAAAGGGWTDDSVFSANVTVVVNRRAASSSLTRRTPAHLRVNETIPLDLGAVFTMFSKHSSAHFPLMYGRFPARCDDSPCHVDCFLEGEAERQAILDKGFDTWARSRLSALTAATVSAWKRDGGIRLDDHVSMNTCSYRSRTHYNPSGLWLHIIGRNVSVLRMMVDGYNRHKRALSYVRRVVHHSPRPLPAMAIYISTVDFPCNPALPYFTFFMRRGIRGFLMPDDTFGPQHVWQAASAATSRSESRLPEGEETGTRDRGGAAGRDATTDLPHDDTPWTTQVRVLTAAASREPYRNRKPTLFFRGSPTHALRGEMERSLKSCCPDSADVSLAVVDRFKHLAVPLVAHAKYRYLMAVRGRVASNRDKYLMALNSTVVWAADSLPWFQFYHALWRPFVNFIPATPDSAACLMKLVSNDSIVASQAEVIASEGMRVTQFLSQDVVDAYFLDLLEQYASLQRYTVAPDPIYFIKQVNQLVRKRYRNAQMMPDDRNPVKFMAYEWLSRRWRQIASCRENNGNTTFSFHNQTGCWYM